MCVFAFALHSFLGVLAFALFACVLARPAASCGLVCWRFRRPEMQRAQRRDDVRALCAVVWTAQAE
jgi:hypothetical protein